MAHPEQRDLQDTQLRLQRWLTAHLPGSSDLRVANLTSPSVTGFSSDTLLFDLEWVESGQPRRDALVIRLEPRGFNVFPSYDVGIQYRVMKALAATDVPVPEMLWYEPDATYLGARFYVMRRLQGWVPSDNPPYNVSGRLLEMSESERSQVWWSALESMARVHLVDWQKLDLGFLRRTETGVTAIDRHLHYYEDYFRWAVDDCARYPMIRAGLDWLQHNQPRDEPTAVCWGDSRISNMIFQETKCAAVIDWEMASLGNPLQDLAWFCVLDRCFSEGLGIARLGGLPSYEATAQRWHELTGFSLAHLRYYEIFGLVRFSAIMARVIRQMKHYEIMPADHEMDVENLASVTLARQLLRAGIGS